MEVISFIIVTAYIVYALSAAAFSRNRSEHLHFTDVEKIKNPSSYKANTEKQYSDNNSVVDSVNEIQSIELTVQRRGVIKTETINKPKPISDSQLDDYIFIDTETTGRDKGYQVIEMCICDSAGEVIYEKRFKPSIQIEDEAIKIHGITSEMLESEPYMRDVFFDEIHPILNTKIIAGYNVQYDITGIKNSLGINKEDYETFCVMEFSQAVLKLPYWRKLTEIAEGYGIDVEGAHSARKDALLALEVFKKLNSLVDYYWNDNNSKLMSISPLLINEADVGSELDLIKSPKYGYFYVQDHYKNIFAITTDVGTAVADSMNEYDDDPEKVYGAYIVKNENGQNEILLHPAKSIIEPVLNEYSKVLAQRLEKKQQTFKEQQAQILKERDEALINSLPFKNTMPQSGSLTLTIYNEAAKEIIIGEELIIKYFSQEDFIKNEKVITFDNGSGFRFKSNITKAWLRVLGIVMSGYSAKCSVESIVGNKIKLRVTFVEYINKLTH